MISASVEPERLLKELRGLWRDLGKQDANGVLRACAMTLVVVADEAQDANVIGETVAGLMHENPGRVIVVRVRQCAEQVLEARVFAQCWMPFGGRQQICCEQVEIIASPSSLLDVATVVRALIVPDLPSILFCPGESLWALPDFKSLLPLTDKLIVDSCRMSEPAGVLDFLSGLPGSKRRADLMWSRLTPWRQAIARIFEDSVLCRRVYDLTEVRLMYHGSEEPSSIYYLAGWFMHVLGAGVPINVAPGVGPEYARVVHVSLIGIDVDATIGITDRNTAETSINGKAAEVTVFPDAGDEYALRQELAVPGRDPLFDDVLGLAMLMRGAR
ncbi:MAG: glucose-6-phosphate dehydrogenase assembly protein OpcA [Bryobacteraceae bacterium]|nr:glucose-6-phosphate dehydrogenase assembly protein OpcA [Bryobacteraceae bacterium]